MLPLAPTLSKEYDIPRHHDPVTLVQTSGVFIYYKQQSMALSKEYFSSFRCKTQDKPTYEKTGKGLQN
ncbi:hypothetical protein BVRB_7g164010 [Beta vulgaris subsp. vulgaris]|nr:hypothetical protein BVRB_7g164010 [Beta vulgaris subsp. vulgaris]